MKIWVDDVRPAPEGYVWCKSVKAVKCLITAFKALKERDYALFLEELGWASQYGYEDNDIHLLDHEISLIDLDHDAGEYSEYGGDYIKILDWLEEFGYKYPIKIHSMNPVGIANMLRIIEKNGWELVK